MALPLTSFRHYFRRKCEYIKLGNQGISKHSPQSRPTFVDINAISGPISASPLGDRDATNSSVIADRGIKFPLSENTISHQADNAASTVTDPTPLGPLVEPNPGVVRNVPDCHDMVNGILQTPGQDSDTNALSSLPREDNILPPPLSPVMSRPQHGVEFTTTVSMTTSIARRRRGTVRGPFFIPRNKCHVIHPGLQKTPHSHAPPPLPPTVPRDAHPTSLGNGLTLGLVNGAGSQAQSRLQWTPSGVCCLGRTESSNANLHSRTLQRSMPSAHHWSLLPCRNRMPSHG